MSYQIVKKEHFIPQIKMYVPMASSSVFFCSMINVIQVEPLDSLMLEFESWLSGCHLGEFMVSFHFCDPWDLLFLHNMNLNNINFVCKKIAIIIK